MGSFHCFCYSLTVRLIPYSKTVCFFPQQHSGWLQNTSVLEWHISLVSWFLPPLPPSLLLSLTSSFSYYPALEKKKERSSASWLRECALPLSCRPREERGEKGREGKGMNKEKREAATHLHLLSCVLQPWSKWESARETERVCKDKKRERKREDLRQPCPWELHHNSLKRAARRCE